MHTIPNGSPPSAKKIQVEHGYGMRFQGFQNLMRYRIRDILLVSSLYDSYLLEEDGRLYELIRNEYQGLNLSHSPELTRVSSGREALQMMKDHGQFDIIITTLHIEDMSTLDFAKKCKKKFPGVPTILLAFDNRDLSYLLQNYNRSIFDNIFIWQGDFRIIISIIKYIEDKNNVENDTLTAGVESIIVIEDNPKYYSSFLPNIYTELMKQSQRLISEGINLSHKSLRMRARPKILLSNNYEDALDLYHKYKETILGIITDLDFYRKGKHDPEAGIRLIKEVKRQTPDIPILLQSNFEETEEIARKLSVDFVLKDTPRLLDKLRKFMILNFSFGNFIFKRPNGEIVAEASDLLSFENAIKTIPAESLLYHAGNNDFSRWLKARTEFAIAHKLKPKKTIDFPDIEKMRVYLLESLRMFRKQRQQGIISDFNVELFDENHSFARIGAGSLGGKARGLGFINSLINNYHISTRFKDIQIAVPAAVVLATDIFDQFMDANDLRDFALQCEDNDAIIDRFRKATFSETICKEMKEFLELVNSPLAIRSSSLLEDSQYHPFAGVYETLMVPNNHPNIEMRLEELILSIKYVFASTYFTRAKNYIRSTSYRMEEEKMAVIIQKIVGSQFGDRFYPELSGVAKSHNFYPIEPLKSEDGIVSIGLGLGKLVVEGGPTVKFCTKYPTHISQISDIKTTIDNSQHTFFALNMEHSDTARNIDPENMILEYPIQKAEDDGIIHYAASTYSHENNIIYDGISRQGIRVITYAPILKYKIFPLPHIVQLITEMGSWGMGTPIEIEFAARLQTKPGEKKEFAILQIRPLVQYRELEEIRFQKFPKKDILCESTMVLGNGVIDSIKDIIFVDYDRFDRANTRLIAQELFLLNRQFIQKNIPYLLIGLGRWGSADPWLGIPVSWDQISGAKIIVEAGLKDIHVEPSQGSHFFQNITSFGIGYFSINQVNDDNYIDWDWLKASPSKSFKKYIRYLHLDKALTIKMDGHHNKGLILKPGV